MHPLTIDEYEQTELQTNYAISIARDKLPTGVETYVISDPLKYRYQFILANTNISVKFYDIAYAWGALESDKSDWHWKSAKIKRTRKKNYSKIIEVCHFQNEELKGFIVILPDNKVHYTNFHNAMRNVQGRIEIESPNGIGVQVFQVGDTNQKNEVDPVTTKWFINQDKAITSFLKVHIKRISFLQEIKIVEPYLSEELINLLSSSLMSKSNIKIITIKLAGNHKKKDRSNVESAIRRKIQQDLSDHQLEIRYVVDRAIKPQGIFQGVKSPFHDRYFIGKNAGIIVGTSINSIVKNTTFVTLYNHGKSVSTHFDDWFSGDSQIYDSNTLKTELWYNH